MTVKICYFYKVPEKLETWPLQKVGVVRQEVKVASRKLQVASCKLQVASSPLIKKNKLTPYYLLSINKANAKTPYFSHVLNQYLGIPNEPSCSTHRGAQNGSFGILKYYFPITKTN